MTEKEKQLLLAYIVSEDFRIDQELGEFQQRLRFRAVRVEDLIEGLFLYYKREMFDEFSTNVLRLLNLDDFR